MKLIGLTWPILGEVIFLLESQSDEKETVTSLTISRTVWKPFSHREPAFTWNDERRRPKHRDRGSGGSASVRFSKAMAANASGR
jgi:hypothetical protein